MVEKDNLTTEEIEKMVVVNDETRPFVENIFPEIRKKPRIDLDLYYQSEQDNGSIQIFPGENGNRIF